ncbi:MAG: hypothetical protein AB7V45_11745 [Candidatus Krumholzibacteriia bacterium]
MRRSSSVCTIALALVLGAGTALAASIPVPGVGVVIKKCPPPNYCGPSTNFGAPGLPALPADFFHPGSLPFEGLVDLERACQLYCYPPPCDEDCDDLRIDFSMDAPSGPFDTSLVPLSFRSVAPIAVGDGSGVDSFFDVWVEVLPPSGSLTVSGSLSIESGTALLPGTASFVVDSFFDIEYRITFTQAGTTDPAGQPVTGSMRLDLQDVGLPIACLDDGSPTGVFVLGHGGGGSGGQVEPFGFADSGGGFELTLESVVDSVVESRNVSWGTAKSLFR